MDRAARTARSASSSWATGAPKTAMMPSPVSLSTWPPKVFTAPASAASTRSVTAPTRSGSRSSDQAVKSDRSPNRTVTTRRSAAGSVAAAGRAAPQLWQNRAPGTATVPHTGQVTVHPTSVTPVAIPRLAHRDRRAGPGPTVGGRPERAVDVGVDGGDHLLGRAGAIRDGLRAPGRAGPAGGRGRTARRPRSRPAPGRARAARAGRSRRSAAPGWPGSRRGRRRARRPPWCPGRGWCRR